MPLVVPGVTTKEPDNKVEEPDNKLEEPDNKFEEPDNKLEEWSNKLVGKKITDDEASTSDEVSFAKRDLPDPYRVIAPGTMVTKDFRPERLNVYVREDGIVSHVQYA